MGNSINSDDEGAEGSPPLLRGHLVLVYLQSRLAVEDTAVRDAARSTTRTTSMYNAGIEKAIPAMLEYVYFMIVVFLLAVYYYRLVW